MQSKELNNKVTIRMSDELKDDLDNFCQGREADQSSVIRESIKFFLLFNKEFLIVSKEALK